MDFSRRVTPVFLSLTVAVVMAVVGCESSGPAEAESRPAPAPPTPEEQFANIFSTLKQKVEDPAIRGGSAEPNFGSDPGMPVTDWTTTVSHEMLPVEEGKPRRAVITIATKSTITVVLAPHEADDQDQGRAGKLGDDLPAIKGPAIKGIPLESLRAPGVGTQRLGGSSIKTLPDEQKTRLGFEHRDGEWVLVTPIDAEEEPFTAAAVQYALRRQ